MTTRAYGIANPTFRPVLVILALAYTAGLIAALLRSDLGWFLYLLPTLLLVPWAYAFHRAGLAWIRISEHEIEIVPSWFARKMWSGQNYLVRYNSDSELLFCLRFAYGSPDGCSVILRSPYKPDQTLWSTASSTSGVSRKWWSQIAPKINDAHGLRARLIKQVVTSQGVSESDWPSDRHKMVWQVFMLFVFQALAPWLGIGVRLLSADPTKLALAGVLLWLCAGTYARYWVGTKKVTRQPELISRMLLFTLQFATFYTFAVLMTGAVLKH